MAPPKKPKKTIQSRDIISSFGGAPIVRTLESAVAKSKPTTRGRMMTPAQRRSVRRAKRVLKRHPKSKTKLRTISIDVDIHPIRSTRGSFEGGDFKRVESEIIHYMEYDPVTSQLAVQLTAAGKWKWYTYQNVTPQTADDFKEAGSKGQYYNKYIKKHDFKPGKHV